MIGMCIKSLSLSPSLPLPLSLSIYVHVYLSLSIYIYIHISLHIYIYIYIYTHNDIHIQRKEYLIKDASLKLSLGSRVAICGRNGCGNE